MASGPLPTGTLTLLFSDIEGSTVLLHRLGDRWGEALSDQRAILRAAFTAHDGVEMGTEGDSFFVVFTTARQAVAAAIAGQRGLQSQAWPDGVSLRVRMGIHTGEPQRHEDGYIGEDVHRAARIGSTANGAQIVVSAATQRLLPELPDATLRDLGHHRLKDLAGEDRLFDVVVPGLITEFPPIRSLGRGAASPTWTTPLVGRDRELRALVELAAEPMTRSVTLTGPGGSGKTRLAVAAATTLAPTYRDGVYFIALNAAVDASSSWLAIAEALDLSSGADADLALEVVGRLRDHNALLVLDNVEQIAGADAVVGSLLAGAPDIDVLATSRRPLMLVREREFPVDPLELPSSGDFDAVTRSAAVAVFVEHARLVRPNFQVTPENSAAVASLCRRLDGLPLALELAAAQSRLLSPSALLNHIDGTLGSSFAASDRPERQRTLDDVVAWSYDLLAETDRKLFRQLGVFEHSADLDAITAVADLDGGQTLDAVARLVTASVVRVDEGIDHEPRISMLQTIRSFARDRLDATDEGTQVRMRHLTWCAEFVERIVPMLGGSLHTVALDRLAAIDDDIRAALRFALDPSLPADPDRQAVGHQLLITVTTRYWYLFGSVVEAREWQERALSAGDDRDSESHIGLLFGLALSMLLQSALEPCIELLHRCLDMSRRLAARRWEARIMNVAAVAHRQAGEFTTSLELLEASLALAAETGDDDTEAKALGNLAVLHHDLGDFDKAARAAQRSLELNTARGNTWGVLIDEVNYTAALMHIAGPDAAAQRLAAWLPAMHAYEETELMIDVIELAGAIAARLGRPAMAAQLLGAADARRDAVSMPRTAAEAGRVEAWVTVAKGALPADDWHAAYVAGGTIPAEGLRSIICSIDEPVSP